MAGDDFQTWVASYGTTAELAAKLQVSVRTINHWVNREGYPKVDTMRELIKLSKGVLSYEVIIDSCQPRRVR